MVISFTLGLAESTANTYLKIDLRSGSEVKLKAAHNTSNQCSTRQFCSALGLPTLNDQL